MKGFLRSILPCVLSISMVLGMAVPAGAAFQDYTDTTNHWAKVTLERAYDAGFMSGTGSTTMEPNGKVTKIQAGTILCRVFRVMGEGDISAFEIPAGAWYEKDAAKAAFAGYIDSGDAGTLNQPLTRGEAFLLFSKAFQTAKASPDETVLDAFPDVASLTGSARREIASLVEDGVINGIGGELALEQNLTRAEFATILFRLLDRIQDASSYTGGNAETLAVYTDEAAFLPLDGTGTIKRLIFANPSGGVNLRLPDTYSVDTLTIAKGSGSFELTGKVSTVEITGSNRTVTLHSDMDRLLISGVNNEITLSKGVSVKDIVITGKNNRITLEGYADSILVAAPDNRITGGGKADEVTLHTKRCELSVSTGTVKPWENYDLDGVEVSLTAPGELAAGDALKANAKLTVPQEHIGKLCSALWYLNGERMQTTDFVLGKEEPSASFVPNYNHSLTSDTTLRCVIRFVNTDGEEYTQEDTAPIHLELYSDLGIADTEMTLTAPATLPAGQPLVVSASIASPEKGKTCKATWYVDNKEVSSADYVLGSSLPALHYSFDYRYGMAPYSTVKCVLSYTTEDGRAQTVEQSAKVRVENYPDNGIAGAKVQIEAASPLDAGATLTATGKITCLEAGKTCTATWYVDDKAVTTQTIVLGTDTPKLSHTYTYTEGMSQTSEIKLVLSCTTADGRKQEVSAAKTIALKNYDYQHYHGVSEADVLNTVTNQYAGDYTLTWAQTHDYTPELKTAWVNLKGYASNTKYLIWVNLTYQRVNVFEGYQGHWYLVRSCLCGSGKAGTPTIKGVFTTSYKQTAWDYGSYYCGPIVRFNGSSGYAFHSRLEYYPMNSDRYYDASIGFPVSHGCLRMYNDDIWWLYNNIPNGTTVVVH